MKKSSKKLLLFLGLVNAGDHSLDYAALDYILPELSAKGIASLVYLLQKNFLVESHIVSDSKQVRITASGMRSLRMLFPGVLTTNDEQASRWHCAVFVASKQSDKAFRYLRSIILTDGAYQLTRGVYIKAAPFSERFIDTCAKLYQSSVSIFSIDQFIFGIDSHILANKMGATEHFADMSGISKEIEQLLSQINNDLSLRNGHKPQIQGLLERIYQMASVSGSFNAYSATQADLKKNIYQNCLKLIKLL